MLTQLRTLLSRLAASLGGRVARDRETDEEIRLHIEMLVSRFTAQGMTEEEARSAALRQFGRKTALQEDLREKRAFPQIDTFWRDTVLAFRQLRRKPSFTISIGLTLVVGIGASTTIFGITYAVLLHALPYADPDRLVSFQSTRGTKTHPGVPAPDSLSYPDLFDFRRQNKVFSHLVSYRDSQFTLTAKVPAVQLQGEIVSWDLFPMLGVTLLHGGGFRAQDEAPGMHAAVLSYRLWQDHFGGNPNVAGQIVSINGRGYRVAGVAPAGFQFPPQNPGVQVWVTLADDSVSVEGHPLSIQRGSRVLDAMGRLAAGVKLERAKAEMDAIAVSLARQYPDDDGNNRATWVHPALDAIVGDTKTPILILCGAVGLLMLVACANVANLLLVRGSERRQEFAMRAALGASPSAILRQWLWETLALGSIGCGFGLVAAALFLRVASTMAGDVIPRLPESKLRWQVIAFAVGLMLLTSIAFSIVPAVQSFRLNLERVLRDGSRSVTGRSMRLRDMLVISQITLSLTLLTGAELLMASFIHLAHRDPGFEPDHILTFSVGLSDSAYPRREQQLAFWNHMLTSLRALPGVKQAATGAVLPLTGDQMSVSFDIEERRQRPNNRPHSAISIVSPDYFSTLGIRLLKGRSFTEHDDANSPPVLVVNQAFADKFFPGESVLGKRIEPGATNAKEGTRLREIVGVVANARQNPLAPAFEPIYYFPYQQLTWFFGSVILKTSGPPRALENSVRTLIAGLDRQAPIYDVRTMDELASVSLGRLRFPSVLLSSFAGVTLLLTAIGLYGTLAYSVEMRRREFGIRMALGAAPGQVLSVVIRKAVLLITIGLVTGAALSVAAQRLLAGVAFVTSQGAAGLLLAGCLTLTITGLLAASLPAFRAASIDPTETLRQE